jgi:hypothetical protein
LFSISFELMEIRDLAAKHFRPGKGGVYRESHPRANMTHSLALVTTEQ